MRVRGWAKVRVRIGVRKPPPSTRHGGQWSRATPPTSSALALVRGRGRGRGRVGVGVGVRVRVGVRVGVGVGVRG